MDLDKNFEEELKKAKELIDAVKNLKKTEETATEADLPNLKEHERLSARYELEKKAAESVWKLMEKLPKDSIIISTYKQTITEQKTELDKLLKKEEYEKFEQKLGEFKKSINDARKLVNINHDLAQHTQFYNNVRNNILTKENSLKEINDSLPYIKPVTEKMSKLKSMDQKKAYTELSSDPLLFSALLYLSEGSRSTKEIGEHLGIEGSELRYSLQFMEELGLIASDKDQYSLNFNLDALPIIDIKKMLKKMEKIPYTRK